MTRHKLLCAEFLEANYDKVFTHYQKLLNSENYVTRRQALKVRYSANGVSLKYTISLSSICCWANSTVY